MNIVNKFKHLSNILILFDDVMVDYEEHLKMVLDGFAFNQDNNKSFKQHYQSEFESLLESSDLEMHEFLKNTNPMARVIPKSISNRIPKNISSRSSIFERVFIEKLYFDLFSNSEDFNSDLLKLINPENGLLDDTQTSLKLRKSDDSEAYEEYWKDRGVKNN